MRTVTFKIWNIFLGQKWGFRGCDFGINVDCYINVCFFQTAEQVTGICRTKEQRGNRSGHHHTLQHQRSSAGSLGAESPVAGISGGSSPTHSHVSMGARDVEKTKKVVLELIDTERAYVKVRTNEIETLCWQMASHNNHVHVLIVSHKRAISKKESIFSTKSFKKSRFFSSILHVILKPFFV